MTSALAAHLIPSERAAWLSTRGCYDDEAGLTAQAIVDYSDAIVWAGKATDQDRGYARRTIRYALGNRMFAYYREKDYTDAVRDGQALVAMQPRNGDAYDALANFEHSAGDLPAAVNAAQKAVSLEPSQEDGYFQLSSAYEDEHRDADALTVCQQEVRMLPGSSDAYGERGWFEYKLKDFAASIADSRKALSLNPVQPGWIYFNMGLAYAVQNDWPSAKTAYLAALRSAAPKDRLEPHKELLAALKSSPQNTALRQSDQLFSEQKP
jgi:tetratricopeptide (TPR) repeat protein